MNRLVALLLALVAAAVGVLGVRLLLLLERLLSADAEVVRDLARSHVPEPAPSFVAVDAAGNPLPDWTRWQVPEGEVDPTDAGLPSHLATERGLAPWETWPERPIDEPGVE